MVDEKYRSFFVQSTVGMVCIDLAGCLSEVNEAFCQLLGYPATELLGMPFYHLVHPADMASHQRSCSWLMTDATQAVELEQRLLCHSGESHWVLSRFSKLYSETTQACLGIAGTFEDIHHRKQLEADQLRNAERNCLMAAFTELMLRTPDLEALLQSAVESVRRYLKVDRVVVYRFDVDIQHGQSSFTESDTAGTVIVESVGAGWQSMLHHRIKDPCLKVEECLSPYRQGQVSAITNIYRAGYDPCHIAMLEQYQIIRHLQVLKSLLESDFGDLHCESIWPLFMRIRGFEPLIN